MKLNRYLLKLFTTALLPLLLHSCKKTEIVEYEKESQNRILEYRVTNSKQSLYGAINQDNNTITIYIPYYLSIDYLVADIKLDEGAIMLDSTGTEINLDGGLDPLPVGTSIKYTVRGADEASRTYTIIQKISPYDQPLTAWFTGGEGNTTGLEKPVGARFSLYGNFASISKAAKFTFRDKQTGTVYHDFFRVWSVAPGNSYYSMTVDVLPDARAGEFDVHMEHQGRKVQLPSVKLKYQPPRTALMSSSASYAPGDTIVFDCVSGADYGDAWAGVFVGVKRMYLKFTEGSVTVPAGFPQALYGQKIEMQITSATRMQVKAIFPQAPAGHYLNNYKTTSTGYASSGMGFYFDFDEQTDWGNDVLIGVTAGGGFEVKAKP